MLCTFSASEKIPQSENLLEHIAGVTSPLTV
jgi:hypothetical protein